MQLRKKVFSILSIAWLLLFSLVFFASFTILQAGFSSLETRSVFKNIARIHNALVQHLLDTTENLTLDWAHWNDSYQFAIDKNPEYIKSNFSNARLFTKAGISIVAYFDKENNFIYGRGIDLKKSAFTPLPPTFLSYIENNKHSFFSTAQQHDFQGFIQLPEGILWFTSSPILPNSETSESRGVLMMGKFLDKSIVDRIGAVSSVTTELQVLDNKLLSPELQKVHGALQKKSEPYVNRISSEYISAYTYLYDIADHPIAILKVTVPRVITQQGHVTITYYLITLLALGFIISLLFWWLLKKLVLKRLEEISSQVISIGSNKEFSKRLRVVGDDELSSMVNEINTLLDVIAVSNVQLEERVRERTQELQQANLSLNKSKERLDQLAYYDTLTGLPNRALFNELMHKAIEHAKRNNTLFTILFLDIDQFKQINDLLGHTTGDQLLSLVANRLKQTLRSSDVVARLGGDEFIILLDGSPNEETVCITVERVLKSISMPVVVQNHELHISTSIGISIYPKDGNTLERLQSHADMAMYRAKRAGGNSFHFYSHEFNFTIQQRVALETELRAAVKNKEFVLYYQPIFDVKTKKIVSLECLIRWLHPQRGLIAPNEFIHLLEESGLIVTVGEWVLETACMTLKTWQNENLLKIPVTINLSPLQFDAENIVEKITTVLRETKLSAQYLQLEITEGALLRDDVSTIKKLSAFKALGIQIGIDDFGIAYSALSYLKNFPIDFLKIDKSFVSDIPANVKDSAIARAIVHLAHDLELRCIAEGVETEDQFNFLAREGCDAVQGFLFSHPMPAHAIKELLETTIVHSSANL